MSRTARLLLCFSLGPITGPLVIGLTRSIRERRHVMAGVYGLAILETWVLMGAAAAQLLPWTGIHV